METKNKKMVFKDFADLQQVKDRFNKAQSLESVTAEMAGKEEYSNADGSEVDSFKKIVLQLEDELRLILKNIQNTEISIDDKKRKLSLMPVGKEAYNNLLYDISLDERNLGILKKERDAKRADVSLAKIDYNKAKFNYDKIKAEESKIDIAAYEKQKQLEAEASAQALLDREAFELEQEKSAILKKEKKDKTKKMLIYGGIGLALIIGFIIAKKKGVFKK
jgi:hypothetical protein